jgi:cholesterol oxidase
MQERVHTVVVGSGFGGAVAACRLAEHGDRVVVLERGRRYPPGSFARSPAAMARNFWDPSEGCYGLFNVWSFRNIEAVVSSGLGGGSLIYANVLMRKDPTWFAEHDRDWPITYEDLEPHYARAEAMLGATPYPFAREPYAATGKTAALREGAQALRRRHPGATFGLPNLAVSFTPSAQDPALGHPLGRDNLHGAPRATCTLCGECDIGCNVGAKNSLDLTYLSVAQSEGADIRDLCEVRTLRRAEDGGFLVGYRRHVPGGEADERVLHARRVVMGAGALGTTFLLMRNRAALGIGRGLGTRFCGNGDLLGFARDLRTDGGYRDIDPSRGPVITSYVRVPDARDRVPGSRRGFYIEDAGWPQALNWLAETADVVPLLRRVGSFVRTIVRRFFTREPDSDVGGEVSKLLGDGHLTGATLGLLGMGRDEPDGTLSLSGDRLACDWSEASSRRYFEDIETAMDDVARGLGGRFMVNPTRRVGRRLVTVHPLGGCPMGDVVDEYGRVLGQDGELYVVDGSVMPGPVGANPSLTIAAFAERAAARMTGRT